MKATLASFIGVVSPLHDSNVGPGANLPKSLPVAPRADCVTGSAQQRQLRYSKFDAERGLALAVADLRTQVRDLTEGGIERVVVGRAKHRAVERVEVVKAQTGAHTFADAEGLDRVEVFDARRRGAQGAIGTHGVSKCPRA